MALLHAIPVAYRQLAHDMLVIDGATPEWFGPFAAQHQLVLYELIPERGSLRGLPQPDPRIRCGRPASDCRATRGGGLAGPRLHASRTGMIAIVRSEWLKMRTTAVPWVLAGIALIINGLLILVYFVGHGDGGGNGGGNGGNGTFGFPNYPHTTQQLRNLLGS